MDFNIIKTILIDIYRDHVTKINEAAGAQLDGSAWIIVYFFMVGIARQILLDYTPAGRIIRTFESAFLLIVYVFLIIAALYIYKF